MPVYNKLVYERRDYRKSPDVSVIIPAYNHEKFVRQAINSVIYQTYRDIELVVVDDGSTDETLSVCIDTAKTNHRINIMIFSGRNQGAHAAINFGVQNSTGKFITILNSDDAYMQQRLDVLRFALINNDALLAFSRIRCIDEKSTDITTLDETAKQFRKHQEEYLLFPSVGFALLKYNIAITTGNLFFERRLFDQIGGFHNYRYCHDWDFILTSLVYSEPKFIYNELYKYRLHGKNTFLQLGEVAKEEVTDILQRFFALEKSAKIENPFFPSVARFGQQYQDFIKSNQYYRYFPK